MSGQSDIVSVVVKSDAVQIEISVRLTACENVLSKGQAAFVASAKAVVEIVDNRLFASEFSDKSSYFVARWDWSKQDLLRFENAGRVLQVLEREGFAGDLLPKNEGQCRELHRRSSVDGKFDEARLVTLWHSLTDSAEKITAKMIAEKAHNLFPKVQSSPSSEKDKGGSARQPSIPRSDAASPVAPTSAVSKDDICTARIRVRLESSLLQETGAWVGVEVVEEEPGVWAFDRSAESKSELLKELAYWVEAWNVVELTIRFVN